MKRILLFSASLGAASCANGQESISLATESYPPFSYRDADGSYKGAGIDQVEAIMSSAGLTYTIEIMPWARAITLAETSNWHCAFAAARTPEREDRFQWIVPLYIDRSILVRRAGSPVQASTIEEAKRFTVGTHREDYTEQALKAFGFTSIDLSADIDTTLRKLLGGRIDMMTMSQGAFEKLKTEGTAIEKVMDFAQQQLGIACNKNIPQPVVSRMQSELDRLIATGTQKSIENRYGIKPSP